MSDLVECAPAVARQVNTSGKITRLVIAQTQQNDPNGYGPNWSNVDDFDIPTVLRKQMD